MHPPSTLKIATAFAAVYILWGGTFLAIRYGVETMPPYLMAGVRFVISGAVLYGWTRARGAERPSGRHWISATILGALLLLVGNGNVAWAEQRVSSGMAAMLLAGAPLWMVTLDWLRPDGRRPRAIVMAGVVLGLAGLAVLVGPGSLAHSGVDPVGAAVLMVASLSWAAGSLYSQHAPLPRSLLQATGMEMLAGGALLIAAAFASGQTEGFTPAAVSTKSLLSLLYLITGGSLLGFTAYIWLLSVTTPARVATYAYVNPVVAVFLGWAFAGEPITTRILVAALIIAVAVALVTSGRAPASADAPTAGSPCPLGAQPVKSKA